MGVILRAIYKYMLLSSNCHRAARSTQDVRGSDALCQARAVLDALAPGAMVSCHKYSYDSYLGDGDLEPPRGVCMHPYLAASVRTSIWHIASRPVRT